MYMWWVIWLSRWGPCTTPFSKYPATIMCIFVMGYFVMFISNYSNLLYARYFVTGMYNLRNDVDYNIYFYIYSHVLILLLIINILWASEALQIPFRKSSLIWLPSIKKIFIFGGVKINSNSLLWQNLLS